MPSMAAASVSGDVTSARTMLLSRTSTLDFFLRAFALCEQSKQASEKKKHDIMKRKI